MGNEKNSQPENSRRMARSSMFSPTAIALLLLSSSSQSFAFSPQSSFVRRTTPSTAPCNSRISYNGHINNNGRSISSTSLSMNLFDRFQRVAKSNINNVLKNLEDPEKIMTQAVEDMQADLVKVRQSYAEVTATQRRLLKQKEQADELANDWYQRAQLALQKSNDELAK